MRSTHLFLMIVLYFHHVHSDFIGTQCGNNVCGKNAMCESTGVCVCEKGNIGLPNGKCFKTCTSNIECPGNGNECLFHDAYFPYYNNVSYFTRNYPYSHHHCLYDCSTDDDCGRNAVCKGVEMKKKCECKLSYVGLPYLSCFPLQNERGRSHDVTEFNSVKCPMLTKSKGVKISCLDRDGSEHNCSGGGNVGTSAMFTCLKHYVSKIKFIRLKCGPDGKWSKYRNFECIPLHNTNIYQHLADFDYMY